jgi:NTE family protein
VAVNAGDEPRPAPRDGGAASRKSGDFAVALILGGGNALGSYQAGAYQALQEHGVEPDRIAGASAGAINGAIICGNPIERRLSRLDAFWRPSQGKAAAPAALEDTRRTMSALWSMSGGHPEMFTIRNPLSRWWDPYGSTQVASLYDAAPLGGTLDGLVDFDLLNTGIPRLAVTAVDVESGEDVVFDTSSHRIDVVHIRASSALLPVFAPVEVGGRLLADAGVSANLPLDTVLGDLPDVPTLCIALDLLPLRGPRPGGLGEAITRAQDLVLATQSRRAIAAWQAISDERVRRGATASATLLHIAYSDHAREVSGKAFDFSAESARARWQSGHADVTAALAGLVSGAIETGRPGLTVYAASESGQALEKVRWQLGPVRG